MSTEVNRESLLKALSLVRPAVAQQAYIPALTHFLFDGVSAVSYNDVSAISVRCALDLELCLPAETLTKLLNNLTAKTLTATPGEGGVTFASGRSKVKLPFMTMEDFPFEFPYKEPEATFRASAALLKGIERCLIGVGQDPTHPAQMGVTLVATKGGTVLYSTDNFTISRYESGASDYTLDTPVILPTFFCQQLVALGKAFPDSPITVLLYDGAVVAEIGDDAKLFTKMLVDLTPLDFRTIVARYLQGEDLKDVLDTLPDGFDQAMDRANLVLSDEMDRAVKITVKDGRMKLWANSSRGESSDSLPTKLADHDGFHVDPVLVTRALKLCSKVAPLDKVLVLADGSFTHLIAHVTA